ncbi:MAG: DinB family protein [Pseudomonadota bacterium]
MTPEWLQMMARYNAWQNGWVMPIVAGMSDVERDLDRGAFFGSIAGTLSHLMWGDMMWMARFDGGEAPGGSIHETPTFYRDWPAFVDARAALDQRIADWAGQETCFDGQLVWYSGAVGREISADRVVCYTHFFNHQTHHRGQVHAMLTAAGQKTHDTDIPFMPDF